MVMAMVMMMVTVMVMVMAMAMAMVMVVMAMVGDGSERVPDQTVRTEFGQYVVLILVTHLTHVSINVSFVDTCDT